jgi:hypothetical protein
MNLRTIIQKFLNFKNEKFETTFRDDNNNSSINIYLKVFIIVFIVITLVFDIMKFTPLYDNIKFKNVLDTNHSFNNLIWGIVKINGLIQLIMGYFKINSSKHDLEIELSQMDESVDSYARKKNDINEMNMLLQLGIQLALILICLITLDIIQFTPLMQNKFVNDAVTFSLHGNYMILMIIKILAINLVISDGQFLK